MPAEHGAARTEDRAWSDSRWLLSSARTSEIALYCFPPAGAGAATYRKWPDSLPASVGVHRIQPPGRENRFREPFCSHVAEYVQSVCALIAAQPEQPFALFGHSMGAILAYETARTLRAQGGRSPCHLFVSAFRSPGAPRTPPIHELPDEQFVQELRRRYDGIPEPVLANPDVLALMLPIVRADLALLHSYEFVEGERLQCPVTAIGGIADPWVSEGHLREWRDTGDGEFTVHMLPGGHFYLDSALAELKRIVAQALRP